jgi:acyl-CoA thioesterase YciA
MPAALSGRDENVLAGRAMSQQATCGVASWRVARAPSEVQTEESIAMSTDHPEPRGELSLRTVAMPADTNPAGDIFGGWIMSLMDLAAGVAAGTLAKGRVATAAVSNLSFIQPVKVGDVVCVYTDIVRTGRSSITLAVETWVLRRSQGDRTRVTAAEFVLVAVDDTGHPRPLPQH